MCVHLCKLYYKLQLYSISFVPLKESCFVLSLTNLKPPIFCHQGYLNKGGIVGNSHLWQHAREAGLMSDHHRSVLLANDGSFSKYLSLAGAAVTSTIKSDL